MKMFASILLLIVAVASVIHAGETDPRLLVQRISELCDGSAERDGMQERRELISQLWSSIEGMCVKYLDAHPFASAKELSLQIEKFGLGASAIILTGSIGPAYVVAPTSCSGGTFFIITRSDKGYRVVWNLRNLASRHFDLGDDLGRWAYLINGFHDGPLAGEVVLLPSDRNGNPRFYIDAWTLPIMGLLSPAQISIWTWNGKQAECNFIHTYDDHPDSHSVTLKDRQIRFRVNEAYLSFINCGSCDPGPGATSKLDVTPDGIIDYGETPDHPSYRVMDQLLYRIFHKKDASEIASLAVILKLKQVLHDPDDPDLDSVGMGFPTEIQKGDEMRVTLKTDEWNFVFRIVSRDASFFITDVDISAP
jgi:hypothetical protein